MHDYKTYTLDNLRIKLGPFLKILSKNIVSLDNVLLPERGLDKFSGRPFINAEVNLQ